MSRRKANPAIAAVTKRPSAKGRRCASQVERQFKTGPTKVYGGPASLQRAHFRVEDGAFLEYLPHHIIPYAGSSYPKESAFGLAPGATLLAWEAFSAGRVGRGEKFVYDRLSKRTSRDRGGAPELAEGSDLPSRGEPFGGYPYLGTVYASAPRGTLRQLAEKMHAALCGPPGVLASASAPRRTCAWRRCSPMGRPRSTGPRTEYAPWPGAFWDCHLPRGSSGRAAHRRNSLSGARQQPANKTPLLGRLWWLLAYRLYRGWRWRSARGGRAGPRLILAKGPSM